MANFENPEALNAQTLIGHIHQAQVDLAILADWLARQSDPALPDRLLVAIGHLHLCLDGFTPSHTRH